jgi:hypothetical protein
MSAFKGLSLPGLGHKLHQLDTHAVRIGDEILLALAAPGPDPSGIDVEAFGFEIVERGFDVVHPQAEVLES